MLTLAFATGTEPSKWFRRFREGTNSRLAPTDADDPIALLLAGECVLALARLPDARVGAEHHVVALYEETPGVAVPKGSVYAELEERLLYDDLSEEPVNYSYVDGSSFEDLRAALQVVAANVGVAFAPKPLLKVLAKKQVAVREVVGAPWESTTVALVWRKNDDSELVQDFVGVAKGRTIRSSRHTSTPRGKSPRMGGKNT